MEASAEHHLCRECGYEHDSPTGFYQDMADGIRLYVCSNKVGRVIDRSAWNMVTPNIQPPH
jgi:ribosomal protein L24E